MIYEDATPDDTTVAAFLAARPHALNLTALPVKVWVARTGPTTADIVAVLMLNTQPYLAIDLIRADPHARPFYAILRLWQRAATWLRAHQVPIVCATILDVNPHFQDLVQRMGFVKVGVECNRDGVPVETIFAKYLLEGDHGHSTHAS